MKRINHIILLGIVVLSFFLFSCPGVFDGFNGQVSPVKFSLVSGTYQKSQELILSTETQAASIRYTTDGSEPSETNGIVYSSSIKISSDITIKAIATKSGWTTSLCNSARYVITGVVATPVISFGSEVYPEAKSVEITCSTPDVTIYYTTDGSDPIQDPKFLLFTNLSVTPGVIVRALAVKASWENSAIAQAVYQIPNIVESPVISLGSEIYPFAKTVTLSCSTEGAEIRYTIDGSAPDFKNSQTYSNPFPLPAGKKVSAIAYKSDWQVSPVISAEYPIPGAAAMPEFNPIGKPYTEAQYVSLTTRTNGASIYYTIDGTDPSETKGSKYLLPFIVSSTTIVKAITINEGLIPSSIASTKYTITGTVANPEISLLSSTYTSAHSVSLSCATEGATIRYTLNGTIPSTTNGIEYNMPISISASAKLQVIAYKTDWKNSELVVADYIITGKVSNPVISHQTQTYTSAQTVTLSCVTAGASMHYTIDGTIPSETNGILYISPFLVASSAKLQVIAYKKDWTSSGVVSADYTITGKLATPEILFTQESYKSLKTVNMSCSTVGASIYYTLDETIPSATNGTLYEKPFILSSSKTIKAIACKLDWDSSSVASKLCSINEAVASPVISLLPKNYTSKQTVSLSCATAGASIRYTLDNSIPSETNGIIYENQFDIIASATLQVIAYKLDCDSSSVVSSICTINGKVVTPEISLPSKTYTSEQFVSLSCSTPGASIRYTLDNSIPSEINGFLYSYPIYFTSSKKLRVIAYKKEWDSSSIASADYIITGKVPTPVISISSGTYTSSHTVNISSSDGATIYYTLDGTSPSLLNGIQYEKPFVVSSSKTIMAIAYKTDWDPSKVVSANCTTNGAVSTPVISLPSKTYTSAQLVSLSCSTVGALIRYTLDNSTPSETNGILYKNPLSVSSTAKLQVIAYKIDWDSSSVASADYTITGNVDKPVISFASNGYKSSKTVSIFSATTGSSIRYTIDGSTPSETNGLLYENPFILSSSKNIMAIAYKLDWNSSTVASTNCIINGMVSTPVISLPARTYTSEQTVSLSSAIAGASIRYTLDNSIPSETNGILYVSPFVITNTSQLQVIAYKQDWDSSSIANADYTITGRVATPVISLPSNTYPKSQTVSLSCTTNGASIRYTLDGTMPSATNGILYVDPFVIAATGKLQVIAYKQDWDPSLIASADYVIQGGVTIIPGGPTCSLSLSNMPEMVLRNSVATVTAIANIAVSNYAWSIDGTLISEGVSDSFTFGSGLGIGTHNLTVTAKSGTIVFSKTVQFKVILTAPKLGINFDDGLLPVSFTSSTKWTVVASGAGNSAFCLKSPVTANSSSSSAFFDTKIFTGSRLATISFSYKISTEQNYDKLFVYINGVKQEVAWSGTSPWTQAQFTADLLGKTTLVIEWRYTKDSGGKSGEDAVYIDDLSIEYR